MNYQDILEQVVNQGAVRVWRASGVWSVAYRLGDNGWEARSLHKNAAGDWRLGERMVGFSSPTKNGWYPTQAIHAQATPVEHSQAKNNPGYYAGLTKSCYTCKQEKPLFAFEREITEEQDYRNWECNRCAQERIAEIQANSGYDGTGGDYVTRQTHASKPPVEAKL